ncbi:thioesterase family protein [Salinibacterium sp. NYA9b]
MRLHIPLPLRWSDVDAYQHVNNAEVFRLLEEARIHAFWPVAGADAPLTAVLDGRPGGATMTLIARQEIEYLLPIPYMREPIDIQMWIGRVGGASLEVCYEIYTPVGVEPQQLFVRASTTLVLVDVATSRPMRISQAQRAVFNDYAEEPLQFAKRR